MFTIVHRYLYVLPCHSLKLSRAFCVHLPFSPSSDNLSRLEIDQQKSMEFFQEPTFTAFLALILSFVVAKLVSFAVSNSRTNDNTIICCINEGAVAKEVNPDRRLRVRSSKSKKKVKFVDDVVIRRVDRYEGGSTGEVIVEENSMNQESKEKVDQFGENELNEDSGGKMSKEQCFDVRETNDADENTNSIISEKEKTLVGSGLNSVIVQEQKKEGELEGDDMIIDQKEGNGVVGSGEKEGLVTRDSEEEREVRDVSAEVENEDDDWEGIERSELDKVFAEAVNYLEYGRRGKDKEDDQLAKLDNNVQMHLYGLHKVAVEGPCHEPQPMALKLSARAKWNAWQRLGSMSQEVAMEQYVRVLSDSIPEWMRDYSADDDIQDYPKLETVDEISVPEYERNLDLSGTTIGDPGTVQTSVKKDDIV